MTYPTLDKELTRLMKETWKSVVHQGGNGWMEYEKAHIYIRVGPRLIARPDPGSYLKVTIAHIQTPETWTKNGIFTRMIQRVREITSWTLYLEGVREDFAQALLDHYGWERVPNLHPSQLDLYLTGDGVRTTPK